MRVTLHVWRVPRRLVATAMVRLVLPGAHEASFAKFLGTADGFRPRDADLTRYAAVTVSDNPVYLPKWDKIAIARARVELTPLHSRGTWSGHEPFVPDKSGIGGRGESGWGEGAREAGGRDPSGRGPGARNPGGRDPGGRDPGGRDPSGRDPGGRDPGGRDPSGRDPGGGDSGGRSGKRDGMVLALTRARLRPTRAVAFWRAIRPVAREVEEAPGLLAHFGVGEAPVGWQGTVSLWRDAADLARFAYRQPEHRAVIARTPSDRWYAEELFARFAVDEISGDRHVLGWLA